MKSNRNKTIIVEKEDLTNFPILKLNIKNKILKTQIKNKIYLGDAVEETKKIPKESVDLIVADPPYTIRKDFGQGTVSVKEKEFKTWCKNWIKQCHRILKTNGSIYICINWEASSIIESILKKHFTIRNRITWKRDKGRGAKHNWKNNMEDIWFATKSDDYTFNLDEVKIKKPVIANINNSIFIV